MNFTEAIQYMYEQLPMFHRVGQPAYKADLNNARAMDEYFGFPHKQYRTIHIAGTNGKGSVSHMLAAILQTAGYTTGLFTSPHLKDFRERIRVNGKMIPEEAVSSFITDHRQFFEMVKPSFFEMTSALAFEHFRQEKVDFAVVEVGMGGRLDSTNIIDPVLSVITNIGYDHTEFLGETLALIAAEKAGIIKRRVPVVIGEFHAETWPVFERVALEREAPVFLAEDFYQTAYSLFSAEGKQIFSITGPGGKTVYSGLKLDLAGFYQKKNICTVLTAVDQLRNAGINIGQDKLEKALEGASQLTGLMGRWQTIGHNPLIVCDTGHNIDGLTWVVQQIHAVPCRNLHMVIGFVRDKDIAKILRILPAHAKYYFTNASIPRALPAEELKQQAEAAGLTGEAFVSVSMALNAAKQAASHDDFIFVGGSTFVVAEVV